APVRYKFIELVSGTGLLVGASPDSIRGFVIASTHRADERFYHAFLVMILQQVPAQAAGYGNGEHGNNDSDNNPVARLFACAVLVQVARHSAQFLFCQSCLDGSYLARTI